MFKPRFYKMNRVMLLLMPRVLAITLFPIGIFFSDKYELTANTYQHEIVHWRQQIEMLCIFFYVWYFLEWFIKLFFYGKYAYYHISFEEEAYNWTKGNKHFGWLKYVLR